MAPPKTDAKYDLIKFFLSLTVLAIHSNLYPRVLYPWLRLAVPLFFIMSSYFIFSKLRDASRGEQKTILKKFVIRNVQLYVCWFVILLPIILDVHRITYFSHGFFANIVIFIRSVFFGNTFIASWYIPATVIGVFMIHFLSKLLKRNFAVFLICMLSFCVVTLASSYLPNLEGTLFSRAVHTYSSMIGGLVLSFPAALLWIFIGKMFAEKKIPLIPTWLLLCLCLLSCVCLFAEWKWVMALNGSYTNDSYFMLAPLCVFVFMAIQKIKPFYWKHSIHFRNASTVIYVSHGSIAFVLAKYLNDTLAPLTFAITLLCCMVIYVLISVVTQKCRNRHVQKVFKMLY